MARAFTPEQRRNLPQDVRGLCKDDELDEGVGMSEDEGAVAEPIPLPRFHQDLQPRFLEEGKLHY